MTEIFNMLVQTLKDNLSEECTVTSAIVRKNNNTKHYSISIRKDEEPTVPTLYVDDILEDIGDSKISIWDGIKKILVRYNDARKLTPKFADLKILSDKSYILKHVYYQLINATANKELLSTVPHKKFLDLAVIFRVTVDEAQDTSYTYILKEEMTKLAGLTFEELDAAAAKNTKARGFLHIPLSEIVHIYMPGKNQPYVLTNPEKTYGANILLFPEELAKTAYVFEEDFYLIPSSIHELMAHPVSSIEKEYLLETLRSANADPTVVKKEEVLGYRIYRYNRETGTVTFAQKQQKGKNMKIKRNGKEYALTTEELFAAHREFVVNFMRDTLESDFGIDEKDSEKLAEAAYEKYAEGDGKTEYECIEWAANHSVEIL